MLMCHTSQMVSFRLHFIDETLIIKDYETVTDARVQDMESGTWLVNKCTISQ